MKTKIIQFIPVSFAILIFLVTHFAYWCIYTNRGCYGSLIHQIYPYFFNPIYNFALYFFPLALLLIFISRKVFNSWLKFAVWGIPLAILFIWTTPISSGGLGLLSSLNPTRDDAARLAGIVFSALSLILLAYHYFTTRNRA